MLLTMLTVCATGSIIATYSNKAATLFNNIENLMLLWWNWYTRYIQVVEFGGSSPPGGTILKYTVTKLDCVV